MGKTKENTGADVKPDNSGHRERLKKRFMLGGGRDFPDYERDAGAFADAVYSSA